MELIDEFSRIVTAIHAAALAPERWIDAMAAVRTALDAVSSGLIMGEGADRTIKSASLPTDAMLAYSEYYRTVDYVLDAVEQGPVGLVRDGESLVALDPRSEFNGDFMRPYDMDDGLFARLTDSDTPTCFLVAAPRRSQSFATAERFAMTNALIPHLQQALRTQSKLTELEAAATDIAAAVDGIQRGVFIVGPGATIVHANSAAEALLARGDGLLVHAGRLIGGHHAADADLLHSVATALGATGDGIQRGSSILCQRLWGRPYIVHVTPFAPSARAGGARHALVVVVDPDADHQPSAALLQQVFGVTRAEAEVALRIARGHGLGLIADEMSVSVTTVRTHLQHVFAKTATHRQAELTKLLLSLAP